MLSRTLIELEMTSFHYIELKEPALSFSEIVSQLMKLSEDELELLNETQFLANLITSRHGRN